MDTRDTPASPPVQVTWTGGYDCQNGGYAEYPCLFVRDKDGHLSARGTLSTAGSFSFTIWLIGSDHHDLILNQGNDPFPFSCGDKGDAPPGNCGPSGVFDHKHICADDEKGNWHRCNTTKPLAFSDDLSFSITVEGSDDNGEDFVGLVVEPLSSPGLVEVSASTVGAGTLTTPSVTLSTFSSPESNHATSISTATTVSSTTTKPVTSQTPTNSSSPTGEVESATTVVIVNHHSKQDHSQARIIAPAVVVPLAVVFSAVVAFYLWRRRRRLARIAPSALFKGESPEMKPWLPLDAKRSASRQGWD